MTFTNMEFRKALGVFPTGVVIVTTVCPKGERLGLTVSSFNSVSLSPPLVLFSIARAAKSFSAWVEAREYAINVLAEHQQEVSTRFAKPLADKWKGSVTIPGITSAPILSNALATFECVPFAQYDGGDHLIMVGRVVALRHNEKASRPLIFCAARYRRLDTDLGEPAPEEDLWLHGW